jgi:hypothetical protein
MSSESLHEARQALSAETQDRHRAIASLMEELEAVDWYNQRVDAATDEELRSVLAHNRDEEIEHAAMVLEWLRRRWPAFQEQLAIYLGSEGPIVEAEEAAMGRDGDAGGDGEGAAAPVANGSLGIGSLR